LLDHNQTDADLSCILSTEIAIDSHALTDLANDAFDYGDYFWVGRVCIYRYACSPLNLTAFTDDVYFTGAAASNVASKTRAAHDMRPVRALSVRAAEADFVKRVVIPEMMHTDPAFKDHVAAKRRLIAAKR
jgi:hypothetical protein